MRELMVLVLGLGLAGLANDGMASVLSPERAPAIAAEQADWVAKKPKRRKGKGKSKRAKAKGKAAADDLFEQTPAAAKPTGPAPPPPPGAPAPPATPAAAPVLDLTKVQGDTEAARQELLMGSEAPAEGGKKKKKKGGEIDFGGGEAGGDFSFGSDLVEFDVKLEVTSAEKERFDRALGLMAEEDYAAAAVQFRDFIADKKLAEFRPESEYQLAKALYKLGFLNPALKRYQEILNQGPSHRRYRKSVEWLFFMSRKMADELPVLAELARFRNVTFPKAYRAEYGYLLAKYLFIQAEHMEVERLQAEQLARSKKSKAASFDFSSVADAMESGGGFDFSGSEGGDAGGALDFGGGGGGDAGFDFGGGGAMDFGGAGADAPVAEAVPTTATEAIKQGVDMLKEVPATSKFYPRARYLMGLLYYLSNNAQEAVTAFQEVVRVLNPREGVRLDPKLREMAFLSLARIHYGHKQFEKSVYYYDHIDRDSESWLTALFEASWAYFQRGDFEKALGNLLTLHSPFFEREYFPESQIVKAIIYFEACRYPETRAIVDDFLKRYTRVVTEIDKIANSKEAPEKLYERIAMLQKTAGGSDDDVTARLVSLALADPQVRTARDVVVQIEDQLKLWQEMPDAFRQGAVGRETYDALKSELAERVREAGEVTRRKFERELYNLKGMLVQALQIKVEVVRAERDAIQKRLAGEKTYDQLVPATARMVVGDEQQYWPYEGEYWRDELGTYELDFSMCRPLAAAP